jgi:hypothetical protein
MSANPSGHWQLEDYAGEWAGAFLHGTPCRLEGGVDPTMEVANGETPLSLAVHLGHSAIAHLLQKAVQTRQAPTKGSAGSTPPSAMSTPRDPCHPTPWRPGHVGGRGTDIDITHPPPPTGPPPVRSSDHVGPRLRSCGPSVPRSAIGAARSPDSATPAPFACTGATTRRLPLYRSPAPPFLGSQLIGAVGSPHSFSLNRRLTTRKTTT